LSGHFKLRHCLRRHHLTQNMKSRTLILNLRRSRIKPSGCNANNLISKRFYETNDRICKRVVAITRHHVARTRHIKKARMRHAAQKIFGVFL
jgi:hypothetical protein